MANMTEEHVERRKPLKVISILSLIGGVLGAVISPAGWGFLLPITAIVLGGVGRSREKSPKRLWLVGVLLGVVGLVVSAISLFYQYLAVVAVAGLTAG